MPTTPLVGEALNVEVTIEERRLALHTDENDLLHGSKIARHFSDRTPPT